MAKQSQIRVKHKKRNDKTEVEALYQEFFKNRHLYPTVVAFYQKHYVPYQYSDQGEEVVKYMLSRRPGRHFYRVVKGFSRRREKDVARQTERMIEEEAKAHGKAKAMLDLKDYALGVEGYLEDFKMIREALRYALKRAHLLMRVELEKVKENPNYVPKQISLSRSELNQIRAYRQFYQSMRTSFKLPIQYTVNYEEQDTQNSVGGLLRLISAYKKSGGQIDKNMDDEISRVDVEFNRD